MMTARNENHDRDRRWLRGFVNHLTGYFAVILVLAVLNFIFTPDDPWVIAPMVGWSPALAIHAAFAMGLMEPFTGK